MSRPRGNCRLSAAAKLTALHLHGDARDAVLPLVTARKIGKTAGVSNGRQAPLMTAAEALTALGRLAGRRCAMEGLLHAVAHLTTAVLPGHPETSISLITPNGAATVVCTGSLALTLDEAQYTAGRGPCLHAATSGTMTEIADTRTDVRWRDYSRQAAEHGNLSSLSVPLALDESAAGSLNIYASNPRAFDTASRSTATRFAPYAAVAISNLRAHQAVHARADRLQARLASRAVIEQAKGILAQRRCVTSERAYRMMVAVSMKTNIPLRDVAERIVHTHGVAPRGRRT